MPGNDFEETRETVRDQGEIACEFEDVSIPCIDCQDSFVWTAGEQVFFRDKNLVNPPKRCKECKRAKNRRIERIRIARETGARHHIEFRAKCAKCAASTTVPFYPSQGRPVYCRACFIEMNSEIANAASG